VTGAHNITLAKWILHAVAPYTGKEKIFDSMLCGTAILRVPPVSSLGARNIAFCAIGRGFYHSADCDCDVPCRERATRNAVEATRGHNLYDVGPHAARSVHTRPRTGARRTVPLLRRPSERRILYSIGAARDYQAAIGHGSLLKLSQRVRDNLTERGSQGLLQCMAPHHGEERAFCYDLLYDKRPAQAEGTEQVP
jgi:hypothetical protein